MEALQPKIRFPEFRDNWSENKIKNIVNRYTNPVKVELEKEYQQIGIRSHGKGLFHKDLVSGESLGNKRVFWIKENALIVNIVFAWEQAVAKTTEREIGMIASHRFPMYLPLDNKSNVDFLNYFFLTKKGKFLLESASPGGAGRNKTLGQKEFDNSKMIVPSVQEQTKIANFLSAVDEKLNLLKEKKALLEDYKKGIMQKIFSQELRFKDDNGEDFEEWEKVILSDVFDYKKGSGLSKDKLEENGINKCILYGELYTKYNEVIFEVKSRTNSNEGLLSENGDLLIPSSTTTSGIDLANVTALKFDNVLLGGDITVLRSNKGVNSVFYAYYLSNHKKEEIASYAQGITIVHLYYSHIKDMIIDLPGLKEQTKIANFLSAIDEKVELVSTQIQETQEYKKGLLQQMFV